MKKELSEAELYKSAKESVEKKRGFKIHLAVYAIFLAASLLNIIINGFNINFIIPALGWGIGVIGHYLSLRSLLDSESEIQREMDLLRKKPDIE